MTDSLHGDRIPTRFFRDFHGLQPMLGWDVLKPLLREEDAKDHPPTSSALQLLSWSNATSSSLLEKHAERQLQRFRGADATGAATGAPDKKEEAANMAGVNVKAFIGHIHLKDDPFAVEKCAALCEAGKSGGRPSEGPWAGSGRQCGAFRILFGKDPKCEILAML